MHKSRMILTDSKKCEIVCFLLGNYPVSEFYMLMFLHTYLSMKMEQSVPKHRHIKFRRRGIIQKKEYNIQNMAKV